MALIDTVRTLIPDLGSPPMYTDADIQVFLDTNDDDPFLAAATALETLATGLAMSGALSTIKTDDLSISEKDTIALYLSRAKSLREQSATAGEDFFTLVYPEVPVHIEGVPLWD